MTKATTESRSKPHFDRPPRKLGLFFDPVPCRYRVAYGGRSSSKSWQAIKGILVRALRNKIRVLCCREIQDSIRDSVKKLIEDTIERCGLVAYFTVTEAEIRCYNGSVIFFAGLYRNVEKIKSFEGIDICYVEEAENVSRTSWEILIPTIRKENSEIWVVFNPRDEKDETYQRFVAHTPENCRISFVNYTDNPYCPKEMLAEAEECRRRDPDAYQNIWLGKCRRISEAAVFYGKFEIADFDPPPPEMRLYFGLDFGFSRDPNALVRCFVEDDYLFIDGEAGGAGIDLDEMPQMIEKVAGASEWQIRADSARPETISFLRKKGFDVSACGKWKGSVEDGVAFIRSFKRVFIHPRCRHIADEFALYSYKVDKNNGEILPIIIDANNHYIDALRYALEPLITARKTSEVDTSESIPLTY